MDSFIQGELFEINLEEMSPEYQRNRSASVNAAAERRMLEAKLAPLPPFNLVKSEKRKRNLMAYRKNGVIEVQVPARLTKNEVLRILPGLITDFLDKESRSAKGEEYLQNACQKIIETYLPELLSELKIRPVDISWRTMNERWGSCTWQDRRIRISHRLTHAPDYVIESVLFHELSHLLVHDHGPDFHEILKRDPNLIRAEAFLEGFEYGTVQ